MKGIQGCYVYKYSEQSTYIYIYYIYICIYIYIHTHTIYTCVLTNIFTSILSILYIPRYVVYITKNWRSQSFYICKYSAHSIYDLLYLCILSIRYILCYMLQNTCNWSVLSILYITHDICEYSDLPRYSIAWPAWPKVQN